MFSQYVVVVLKRSFALGVVVVEVIVESLAHEVLGFMINTE